MLYVVFLSAWARFKLLFLLSIALAAISSLSLITSPKLFQNIIDTTIRQPQQAFERLPFLLGTWAVTSLVATFAGYFSSKISFYIATQTEDSWRYAGLYQFYSLPISWHDENNSGNGGIIERGGSSVWAIINDIFGQDLFRALTTFTVVLIAGISAVPQFWWVFILPIPFHMYFTTYMSEKLAQGQERLNQYTDAAGKSLYDGITNVRVVKSFGKEEEETRRYAVRWSAFHRQEYLIERVNFAKNFLHNIIEISAKAILVVLCVWNIAKGGSLTVGTMSMLIQYQGMLFGPLTQLNQLFARSRRFLRRSESLFKLMREKNHFVDLPNAKELPPLRNQIEVRGVSFSYNKILAVSDLTFTLKAGTTTAFVGRSGAGKSTTVALLMRFYDPSSGRILWDGIDLRSVTKQSLRQRIAIVPQDTSLFNRSIRENIAYGRPNATLEEVIEAAKLSGAHDFIINSTPNGYDSVIGERGVKLSGGQRQRVAIARALLVQPSLLIFDESTSHLDSESELAIKEAIAFLHHKVTQVIIAHRLSTIMNADQIIVLDGGRIVGIGTHHELLHTSQIYKKLYTLQFQQSK